MKIDATLASRFARIALGQDVERVGQLLPLPDPALDPEGCGRYVLQIPNDFDEQQYIGRVDFNAAAAHRLFGRGFYSKYYHAPLFDIDTNPNLIFASGNGLGNDAVMRTFAGGWDWVVNSNPIAVTLIAGLTEEQRAEVRRVLHGMLRERSGGSGPAILTAQVNIGVGTK